MAGKARRITLSGNLQLIAKLDGNSTNATSSQHNVGSARGADPASGVPLILWLGPLLIAAYWLLNCLVVSPAGNFPLNDDWLYSESVQHLLQTGQFRLLGCSPACFLHVAVGAGVSALLGFSHEHLRWLTNGMGLAACFILYATVRSCGGTRPLSTMAGLLLAINPLFGNLSYSFMTDVPALFYFLGYCYFAVFALKKRSAWAFIAMGLMLCAAVLVRQTFAVFGLASLVVLIARWKTLSAPARILGFLATVLAPCAVAMAAERLMLQNSQFAEIYIWYKSQFSNLVSSLIHSPVITTGKIGLQSFEAFCYLGLFCLPLIPLLLPEMVVAICKRQRAACFGFLAALAVCLPSLFSLGRHTLMPFSQNLLRVPMVGPTNLMGVCISDMHRGAHVWVTIIATICAIVTLAALIRAAVQKQLSLPVMTLALFSIGMVVLQTCVVNYDRYYLMALPMVLLVACCSVSARQPKWAWAASAILALAVGAYTTVATQDYMSWNRARWQAINDLQAQGVSPSSIDGGPEFNYTVNPDLVKACALSNGSYVITNRGTPPLSDWRWWPVSGENYIIAFNDVPGYEQVARYPFFGALTFSQRQIITLRKAGDK